MCYAGMLLLTIEYFEGQNIQGLGRGCNHHISTAKVNFNAKMKARCGMRAYGTEKALVSADVEAGKAMVNLCLPAPASKN